jgi:hypothetical protein
VSVRQIQVVDGRAFEIHRQGGWPWVPLIRVRGPRPPGVGDDPQSRGFNVQAGMPYASDPHRSHLSQRQPQRCAIATSRPSGPPRIVGVPPSRGDHRGRARGQAGPRAAAFCCPLRGRCAKGSAASGLLEAFCSRRSRRPGGQGPGVPRSRHAPSALRLAPGQHGRSPPSSLSCLRDGLVRTSRIS